MLVVGSIAPEFVLPSQAGDTIKLSDYSNKSYVVLVFYPGDATPVCTKQLCAIRDDFASFKSKNAVVFGVNPGGADSHKSFVAKHSFPFPLLVDEGKKVSKLYGCDALIMIQRTVYIIAPDGKIIYAKRGNPSTEEITTAIPAE
ncbi:MAG: peroxiredoxin [Fibrobacteres bacterium]|nr:peroxiredoxin [Fibrobacterota bacterium]